MDYLHNQAMKLRILYREFCFSRLMQLIKKEKERPRKRPTEEDAYLSYRSRGRFSVVHDL